MVLNIVTTARGSSSAPAQANTAAPSKAFVAGAIISPERDRIGNYLEELGREQLCIPEDWIKLIHEAGSTLTHADWKAGRWVNCRLSPRDLYRSSKHNMAIARNIGFRAAQLQSDLRAGLAWLR